MTGLAPGRWRVLAGWVAVLAVGTALVATLLARAGTERTLEPAGTGPSGSRALVRVLDEAGVRVETARSLGELDRVGAGAGSTVLVAGTRFLSPDGLRRVAARAASADRLVLVAPGPADLDALGLPVDAVTSGAGGPLPGSCTAPMVDRADTVTGGSTRYVLRSAAPSGARACFPEHGAAVLVDLPARDGDPETVLLGAPGILENGTVTEEDNARVALRLLGSSGRVVWYLPAPADLAGAPAGAGAGAPAWFGPLVLLLGTVVVVTALWRGRRLGPLVTEPLPVLAPATEATQTRARLYRRAGDRARTAAILRAASRERLAARLGVPPGEPPATLVAAVARASGIDPDEAAATLLGPAPRDDATMVSLARACDEIEEKVGRR